MRTSLEFLRDLKELMLFACVVYFYALGIALFFHLPTLGLDHPLPFTVAGTVFLFALTIEALLSWWDKPRFAAWALLWIGVYAVIGFVIAPIVFGPSVLLYVYVEPIVVVFIGGFAFSYARLFTGVIFPERKLSVASLDQEVRRMPGWSAANGTISKEYRFKTDAEADAFAVRVGRIADRMSHHPKILSNGASVTVRLASPEEGGVAPRDIRLAKKIDATAI